MFDSQDQLDPTEAAALYVAGALTEPEIAWFEARLAANDAACLAALDELRGVSNALVSMIEPIPPASAVRESVLRFADSSGETRAYIQRNDPGVWKSLPVPGLSFRLLYIDHHRKTQTVMYKGEPGSVFPAHDHGEAEECYILDGELETLGTVFKAGDFFRAAAGTSHGESRTRTGCTLLITSAIDKDFAAAWI